MKKFKEHPIMLTELILLFTLMAIVIWIGLSETDKYEILQRFLVLFNIVALVVVPFVMLWISCKTSKEEREFAKKRKWERSKEYREQFVSHFNVENPFFGECVFEKDVNKNFVRLVQGITKTKFGPYIVMADIEVSEECVTLALEELAKIYQNAEEILNPIYQEAMKYCNEWDETDEEGNPIDLNYIREHYNLNGIAVSDKEDGSIFVVLDGSIVADNGVELLGYHSFVTEIDCSTGEITYDIWG